MRRQPGARAGRGYTLRAVDKGDGPGAYRDERAALAGENARLRAEVAALRGARRSRAQRALNVALMVVLDVWVFTLIVGWVNAPRDAEVWLGWAAAIVTVGMNVAVAQRVLRAPR